MKKKAFIVFLVAGAATMIVMSTHYLLNEGTGILKNKDVASEVWYSLIFRTHVLFGLLAITIGPSQFIGRLRQKQKKLHRTMGYLYVFAVMLSSLGAGVIAQFSMGGRTTSIGFSILAILWLYTTIESIRSIIKGDISLHKKWSHYSYALTFAAITQRILLLVPLLANVQFITVYRVSAWLPWVLNLGVAHLLLIKQSSQIIDLK